MRRNISSTSSPLSVESLAARLDRLEASLCESVETKRLVVKGADGKVRATIGQAGKLPCELALYSERGEQHVSLTVSADGGGLCLTDTDGGMIGLGAGESDADGPALSIHHGYGKRRARLTASGADYGALSEVNASST